MTIGEVARRAGVATSTVRFYERRGLLTADARQSGQRRYRTQTLRRLVFIGMLQDAGLSLEDIVGVLDAGSVAEWKAIARQRLTALDAEIARLNERGSTWTERSCAGTTTPRPIARSWAWRSIDDSPCRLCRREAEANVCRRVRQALRPGTPEFVGLSEPEAELIVDVAGHANLDHRADLRHDRLVERRRAAASGAERNECRHPRCHANGTGPPVRRSSRSSDRSSSRHESARIRDQQRLNPTRNCTRRHHGPGGAARVMRSSSRLRVLSQSTQRKQTPTSGWPLKRRRLASTLRSPQHQHPVSAGSR